MLLYGESEAPPFVWPQGRIELNPVAPVDAGVVVTILPGHAELDKAFRLNQSIQHSFLVFA